DNTATADSGSTPPVKGSGRLTLLLIAGIPVIMVLASSWLWFFVANGQLDLVSALGTSNRGDLVSPPRQVMEAGWSGPSGEAFDPLEGGTPRWVMVIPQASADCDALCESRLYETRQIHQALGKELGRVRRVLITPADALNLSVEALSDDRPLPADFAAYLATEQRGLTRWQSSAESFSEMFPELGQQAESWYLMDPNGWVMMRYDDSIDYKDVISDLKFLIKNSNG
ncbi:unnamed protein product, partial [Ectocarpus sp. 12 AP-2014]